LPARNTAGVFAWVDVSELASNTMTREKSMQATGSGFGLEGKVCVVTGAGSGIGRAVAMTFAREGARVAILDRNAAGGKATLDHVTALGGDGLAVEVDTSDPASVERARDLVVERWGDADVLVNNAGIRGTAGPLLDLPLEDWNRLIGINLTGYFICSRVFGRSMVAKGDGAIVHVASVTALQALANAGNYSVAKAGVSMLSHLLAAELGPKGVRSNAVHPGLVQTEMTQASYDDPEIARARAGMIPQRRVAQPDDIADAVLYLASRRAAYVNGADLLVDGGLSHNFMAMMPSAHR